MSQSKDTMNTNPSLITHVDVAAAAAAVCYLSVKLPLNILKGEDDRKLSMLNKNASHSIEAIVGKNTRVGSLC